MFISIEKSLPPDRAVNLTYLCLLRIFSSLASSAVSRAGDDVRGQTVARYCTS